MSDLFLARPSKEYEKSFKAYVLAYKNAKINHYFDLYKNALEDFDKYIKELTNLSRGIDVPEGWAPTSAFWLIDKGEVVGVVRVRHQEVPSAGHIGYDISLLHRRKGYGYEILKLALKEAALLGIKEAIVTCNTENTSSKKIIERNNGRFLEKIYDEEDDEYLYKYSITTS